MENDRLNEIREDYDISMHELDVCDTVQIPMSLVASYGSFNQ